MRYIITLSVFLFYIHISAQYISDTGALFSGIVYDVSGDNTVFSEKEELRMIPASLTKVVTTATAIEILGPDFRFETEVFYSGEVIDGILRGDLLIKACGDPTLGSRYFQETNPDHYFNQLHRVLVDNEIKKIDGTIKVESFNPGYSSPRLWEDIGNYYGGFAQGFNWRDNTVEVVLSSSNVGKTCLVESIDPDIYPYAMYCKAVGANHKKDSAYVYGLPEIRQWWIEGSIPAHRSSFKIKAAMPDPQRVFVRDLSDYLHTKGIEVSNEQWVDIDIQTRYEYLTSYKSPRLSEIIRITNQKSNNLFADALFLTIAKRVKGIANWDNGAIVVKEFWKDKIDFEQHFRLRDGSGLTPKNLISPAGMVQLLSWMKCYSSNIKVFETSLAIGGVNGTLKSVFKDPALKGKVIGKSGSMEGVLGYCGYANLSAEKTYCFCVVANNYVVPTKHIRGELDTLITEILLNKR